MFINAKQYRLLSYAKMVQKTLCEQHDQTQKCIECENSHFHGHMCRLGSRMETQYTVCKQISLRIKFNILCEVNAKAHYMGTTIISIKTYLNIANMFLRKYRN